MHAAKYKTIQVTIIYWGTKGQMTHNRIFSAVKAAVLGIGLVISASASADCMTDIKKYRLDKELYNECIREANNTDNGELQYLVALWNFAGVSEIDFSVPRNMNGYKHFIYLAAQNDNKDAMSMYVITQYDRDNNENNGKDLNMVKYLNALSEDKTPEGKLRMLSTKLAIDRFRDEVELPELEELAEDSANLKAKFELARYYHGKALPPDVDPASFDRAYALYKDIIDAKSADDNVKNMQGIALWNMYSYYRRAKKAEVSVKSEPFLKELAMRGDIMAMIEYAKAYANSSYGVLDDAKAYAWISLERDCVKGTSYENEFGAAEFIKIINEKLSDADRKKGEQELASLKKSVKCLVQVKEKRPESMVKKDDSAVNAAEKKSAPAKTSEK